MAVSYTPKLGLPKPDNGEPDWDEDMRLLADRVEARLAKSDVDSPMDHKVDEEQGTVAFVDGDTALTDDAQTWGDDDHNGRVVVFLDVGGDELERKTIDDTDAALKKITWTGALDAGTVSGFDTYEIRTRVVPDYEGQRFYDSVLDKNWTAVTVGDEFTSVWEEDIHFENEGDIPYGDSDGTPLILPIGAAGSLLYTDGSVPSWLAKGTAGYFLKSTASSLGWDIPVPYGYLSGLGLTNNISDPLHDVDIAIGIAADSAAATIQRQGISLGTGLTKALDATWTVGNGGGRPAAISVSANTVYHVFVIRDSSTGVVDAGFDTDLTATNLRTAASYDQYRRIGSVLTGASSTIRAITQYGNYFVWTTPQLDINTALAGTGTTLTLTLPTGVPILAHVNAVAIDSSGSKTVVLQNGNNTAAAPSSTAAPLLSIQPTTQGSGRNMWLMTNTSAQVRVWASATISAFRMSVLGYMDMRGQ